MSCKLPIILFFTALTFVCGEVGKFLEPITFGNKTSHSETKHFLKSSALIAPSSNHGYKDLVKEICGKDISKKEQQSDWGNPKLSEKQISYAAQDTEYLFHIKNKLSEMLERENRKDLYEKCIKVIPILVDIELSGYKINVFEH